MRISTINRQLKLLTLWATTCLLLCSGCHTDHQPAVKEVKGREPLTMIVMDPLSSPLSCPCVEGYAQRDYQQLANFLEKRLGRPIKLYFNASLTNAMLEETNGRADIVIGKSSVVRFDAQANQREFAAVAKLTDSEGSVVQQGWIVVAANDSAQTVENLNDYQFFFGPEDCEEKHQAVIRLFAKHGMQMSAEEPFVIAACSAGATKVLDMQKESVKAATVISSYAARLLEGCGNIPPDSIRVIAKTESVPFIEAFVCPDLDPSLKAEITQALLLAGGDAKLCMALESMAGFVSMDDTSFADDIDSSSARQQQKVSKQQSYKYAADVRNKGQGSELDQADESSWSGWRGNHRNAHVSKLPFDLSTKPKVVWQFPLIQKGLGGIAATEDLVLFGDRDVDDQADVWRCLDAFTGAELWNARVPEKSNYDYDYGNSPRATPLIVEDNAYLLGASGDLLCVDLISGEILWQMNLREQFGATVELPWGYCGSPLWAGGQLIVAPGATDASLVALEPSTGRVLWKTPGSGPSYGSLIVATLGGKKQIVGHDADSIGGWDLSSGKRLWTITPRFKGDFNVPTPLEFKGQLLITTENNGTRLYAFNNDGTIIPKPVASNRKLKPNMSTPVIVDGKLYCVDNFLFCLDLNNGLEEKWRIRDRRLTSYASIIASPEQLLVVGDGELLFLPSDGTKEIVARQTISDKKIPIYSHPAIVGQHLYIRTESALFCFKWKR